VSISEVLVAGHVCVDLSPTFSGAARIEPGALFSVGALGMRVGGSIANTGEMLSKLGVSVRAHGLVGDDDLGRIARRGLDEVGGIDVDLVIAEDYATSYSIVIQPPGQDRTFWHHTGANDAFDGTTVDARDSRLVHLGYPPLLPGTVVDEGAPLVTMLERVRAEGATTSLDLAVVDPASDAGRVDWDRFFDAVMPHVDILTPSIDDLSSALRVGARDGLAAELADRMIERGAGIVAISEGERGLLVRSGSAERLARGGPVLAALGEEWADVQIRAAPVPIRKMSTTNGAGDAATAGLLAALLRGADPTSSAAAAVQAAANWIGSEHTGMSYPSSTTNDEASRSFREAESPADS